MDVFYCIEAGLLQGDSVSIPIFMCHMISGQARDDSRVTEHIQGTSTLPTQPNWAPWRVKALRNSLKVTRSQSGRIGRGEVNQTTPSIRAVKITFLMNKNVSSC